jgi:hypothetical protein
LIAGVVDTHFPVVINHQPLAAREERVAHGVLGAHG